MKKLILCLLLFQIWNQVSCQDAFFQQLLFFQVDPMNEISASSLETQGAAPFFYISCMPPQSLSGSCFYRSSYNVATNECNKKIIAFLNEEIMPGCTLTLRMSPPSGACSLGSQFLSTIPTDMVLNISQTAGFGLDMFYSFSASLQAGVIPPQVRILTLTLTDR